VSLIKILVLAGLALAVMASSAAAASPAHGHRHSHGRIAGVVPHVSQPAPATHALSNAVGAAVPTPTLTFDASYESLINRYFTDVAADSGGSNNVYSVATQYSDDNGNVQYQSTFGGPFVDHNPLPANGCNDSYQGVSDPVCLTDAQLQAEIQNVLTAKGWHGGLSNMYFLMTPDGVGSCFVRGDINAPNQACSTNKYCAYHGDFVDSNGENVIYANDPYVFTNCNDTPDGQGFPNDPNADTTINAISHEHNEAITDPFADPANPNYAWLDPNGYEIGDLCEMRYGTPFGTIGGQPYNQLINGHEYSLQEEYSNADYGCVQSLGGPASTPTGNWGTGPLDYYGGPVMHTNTTYAIYWLPTPGNMGLPLATGTAAGGKTLTTSAGSWNGAPSGFAYKWQRCSSTGTGCVDIAGATTATYTLTDVDVGHTVRSTVRATNVNGQSSAAASAATSVVKPPPLPAPTGSPAISGVAAVGENLSVSNGTWNTPVSYAYQWLRCSADGSGCAAIPGATAANYLLTHSDGGHTLEARVSGTNIAGTATAASNHTSVVIDAPAVTKAPYISGQARVGRYLSGRLGLWMYAPSGYRYQWMRCNAHGGRCLSIRRATRSTYKLTRHDAGHRLRVRVTATNTVGGTAAISAVSARIR